jgi:DNA (cytosine-5)-methyltransferase 1
MGKELPAISLFSGAMGLDLGLEGMGFSVRVAVECNTHAVQTIKANRQDIEVIERTLETVTTDEILRTAGLQSGEAALITGGPCCQSFSTAGRRGSLSDSRGQLFKHFLRVINEAKPQFFIMENVTGVLSAAIKHRPLKERGPGYPHLTAEEELGSGLMLILEALKETGYYIVFGILNAADFGVPQQRERVIFIGSREGHPISMPNKTHAKEPNDGILPWVTLKQGLKDLNDSHPIFRPFSPTKRKFLPLVPEGGNWRDLPDELKEEALGGAYKSWGGRVGFHRRLAWDRPSPALTTAPDGRATTLCHPTDLRPLSVKEYARLQQFPDTWEFVGSLTQKYTQIGNAVPLGLGRAVGDAILQAMCKKPIQQLRGKIVCPDDALLKRLRKRPKTILNPLRMRKSKDPKATLEWRKGLDTNRTNLISLIDIETTDQGMKD